MICEMEYIFPSKPYVTGNEISESRRAVCEDRGHGGEGYLGV